VIPLVARIQKSFAAWMQPAFGNNPAMPMARD
jgi:hypothetical protein